jgi:DNA-binding response OmpR family regulator
LTVRILVVDDELPIRSLLARVLSREGFEVLSAANGRDGLETAVRQRPDLMILDLNLPDMYGEDVCQKIRQDPTIHDMPVLILTGKMTQGLPARCLNGGADDYLPKPFDFEEMVAHLRALLRRASGTVSGHGTITRGHMTIKVAERMVLWKGRRIETLAPKEFDRLRHLVIESPKVLDKNAIALKSWGIPFDQLHQRTLDVHVRRIRKKLGPAAADCLKTIPAVGFQWLDDSISPALTSTPAR